MTQGEEFVNCGKSLALFSNERQTLGQNKLEASLMAAAAATTAAKSGTPSPILLAYSKPCLESLSIQSTGQETTCSLTFRTQEAATRFFEWLQNELHILPGPVTRAVPLRHTSVSKNATEIKVIISTPDGNDAPGRGWNDVCAVLPLFCSGTVAEAFQPTEEGEADQDDWQLTSPKQEDPPPPAASSEPSAKPPSG